MVEDREPIRLSPEEARAQRRRSIAIALVLAALIVTFYLVTIFKMSS